jgi:predicted transcriptional regulator
MVELYQSKAWLHRRFLKQKKSIDEIAVECGTTTRTIYNWLKKFGMIK